MAGYSRRSLVEKLGIKPGTRVVAVEAPPSDFPRLARALTDDGTLWVSWPKRTSGVRSDLTEDIVRAPPSSSRAKRGT